MSEIHVQLTKEDIERGTRLDRWACPVALALWRATGVKWSVGNRSCRRLGQYKEVPLPGEVMEFIREFDEARRVRPLEFDIKVAS